MRRSAEASTLVPFWRQKSRERTGGGPSVQLIFALCQSTSVQSTQLGDQDCSHDSLHLAALPLAPCLYGVYAISQATGLAAHHILRGRRLHTLESPPTANRPLSLTRRALTHAPKIVCLSTSL